MLHPVSKFFFDHRKQSELCRIPRAFFYQNHLQAQAMPKSHFLFPSTLSLLLHTLFDIDHERLCPYSVMTIHWQAEQLLFCFDTLYSHPTSAFAVLMEICIQQVLSCETIVCFFLHEFYWKFTANLSCKQRWMGPRSTHIGLWHHLRARSSVTWSDTYAYWISFMYVHVGSLIYWYKADFLCPMGGAMDMTQ